LQRFYRRKLVQKGLGKASVAVARKLGIRLWIMLRDQIEYNEFFRRGQKQQKSMMPVRGCQKRRMVRTVTGRLIRLSRLAQQEGVRITHHGRW
jgi:hypothetical protein